MTISKERIEDAAEAIARECHFTRNMAVGAAKAALAAAASYHEAREKVLVDALEAISKVRPDKIITNPEYDCTDGGVLNRCRLRAIEALKAIGKDV